VQITKAAVAGAVAYLATQGVQGRAHELPLVPAGRPLPAW
jgi:hypothetical protein